MLRELIGHTMRGLTIGADFAAMTRSDCFPSYGAAAAPASGRPAERELYEYPTGAVPEHSKVPRCGRQTRRRTVRFGNGADARTLGRLGHDRCRSHDGKLR